MITISEENIKSILDSIEELVLSSPKVPIFNRLIIDEDKLFTLLDDLQQQLPKEIAEAHNIVMSRDRILADANNRARDMIASAENRAKSLISNSEILKKAKQEADTLLFETKKDLEKNQEEADKYADNVLEQLETKIDKVLSVVRNGKEKLVKS